METIIRRFTNAKTDEKKKIPEENLTRFPDVAGFVISDIATIIVTKLGSNVSRN